MADAFGSKLDLLLLAEVENRFPCVLESVSPTARHTVIRLSPTELVHKSPTPLPAMRNHEVLHVEAALTFIGVLLNVQKVGAIVRKDRSDIGRHVAIPVHVLVRPDGLEPARWIVFPLRGIRRR